MSLRIKQITQDGRSKVWKLSENDTRFTFGTSRKAHLNSIDAALSPYQCAFEYRNEQWHLLSFDPQNSADVVIHEELKTEFLDSSLSFNISKKGSFVLENLLQHQDAGTEYKKLVLVTQNDKLLATHILNEQEDFKIFNQGSYQVVPTSTQEHWAQVDYEAFTIRSKKIKASVWHEVMKTDLRKSLDKETQISLAAILGLSFLLIGISFLVPRSENTIEVSRVIPQSTRLIVKTEIKKKNTKQNHGSIASETPSSGARADSKTAAQVKASVGLRISQLLRKVSVTESRTANVIVSNGIKAGEAPSGRALAAIGKVESSGRNWNGETVGSSRGVSTAGVGGGQGTQGLGGRLGQGKTGSGGVGLIEDESEIVGGLDREVIAQYIKSQLGQILYCYERQLSATPELYGKIAVKFTISGSGQVETQSINDTTLKNRSVESCILNKIAKWKFPEPRGGTKVLVTYPFLFKSTI